MKKYVWFLLVFLLLLSSASALLAAANTAVKSTPKVVNYKSLKAILPTIELPGFIRQKPEGSTESAFGKSFSHAAVTYEKGSDENLQAIEVKIEDNIDMMNYGGMNMSEMGEEMTQGMEAESDEGYYRNVKIQGFKGSERLEKSENPTSEIGLVLAKRFYVTLKGTGLGDTALLHKLVDNMNLAKLAGLAK